MDGADNNNHALVTLGADKATIAAIYLSASPRISVANQIALCREFAEAKGWSAIDRFDEGHPEQPVPRQALSSILPATKRPRHFVK